MDHDFGGSFAVVSVSGGGSGGEGQCICVPFRDGGGYVFCAVERERGGVGTAGALRGAAQGSHPVGRSAGAGGGALQFAKQRGGESGNGAHPLEPGEVGIDCAAGVARGVFCDAEPGRGRGCGDGEDCRKEGGGGGWHGGG